MLLQRIGYSDMMLQTYVDERDFNAHELKFKIRQELIVGNEAKARELFAEFEVHFDKLTNIDKQFTLHQKVLLNKDAYSFEEKLSILETAIMLTQPKYRQGKFPDLLSYEEIKLLNSIALLKSMKNARKEAIDLLYGILNYYKTQLVNTEEILRTAPMTFYNLSKLLGMENRYDECIDISNQGIQIAKRTGRCQTLHLMLYNKAWAIVKQNDPKYLQEASELANSAYHLACALGDVNFATHCQRFIIDNKL